jgi:hypothetical protein
MISMLLAFIWLFSLILQLESVAAQKVIVKRALQARIHLSENLNNKQQHFRSV